MKQIFLIIVFALGFFFVHGSVFATSEQAYQDYLYQFDVYRQKNNEFSIAKNEYLKFKTLTSESSVIMKAREMLSQRSQLLRAYLLLLIEKVNESTSMSESDKTLYRTLLGNEVQFLENHSQFVNSVQSVSDAVKASEQLESHYVVLQTSIRQTIMGITLAKLVLLGDSYGERMVQAKNLIETSKTEIPIEKQTILDRWFIQISDKRSLYLQKKDLIAQGIGNLKGKRQSELDTLFSQNLKVVVQARQDLKEGTSYFNELLTALQYKN